jgi:hypothetical protein
LIQSGLAMLTIAKILAARKKHPEMMVTLSISPLHSLHPPSPKQAKASCFLPYGLLPHTPLPPNPPCLPLVSLYQTFKEKLILVLLKLVHNMKLFQTHSMKPALLRYQTWYEHIKKRQLQTISLHEHVQKSSIKILANQIHQHIKNIIHHDQVSFIPGMQGLLNICKSINRT